MTTNQAGIDLIKKFEGCKLTAYKDPVGILTIGYGHTNGVYAGMKITQEQADEYLRQDLAEYEKYVTKYCTVFTPNENQFSALVSFCYNCGPSNLIKLLDNRTPSLVAENMMLYVHAGGEYLQGLYNRRKAEVELFNTPVEEGVETVETSKIPVVKSGSKGSAVYACQALLNYQLGASLSLDGSAGPLTVTAIKNFQSSVGITVDGSCGPITWSKLFGV